MSSKNDLFNYPFSHIYVEHAVADHPLTKTILKRFSKSVVIPIEHYKDVFNRSRQNFGEQKKSQSLILARRSGPSVYKGAPVCQDFGYDHFYYASSIMNCIFDCEYCFLKGMYGSGNIVVFVDLEKAFAEVEELLSKHPVYLCVSYDTDLIALESLTGFASRWAAFALAHENLTIEIRTKSFRKDIYDTITPCERVIFAYTLSPDEIIQKHEKKTATLSERLSAASYAMEKGFPVRLCFDPLIYCRNWKDAYSSMLFEVKDRIDTGRLKDISVGSFRIPSDYMKKLRKDFPGSSICQFPYENRGGVFQYPKNLQNEMEKTLVTMLQSLVSKEKIYMTDFEEKDEGDT
ncbi:MAG: radical SAM protein [Clostridiales bacterium]|nr:radical SAM protein [Clostridiales bacterium]